MLPNLRILNTVCWSSINITLNKKTFFWGDNNINPLDNKYAYGLPIITIWWKAKFVQWVGNSRAGMWPLFRVSLALLALQCVDQNATVQLLINMKILAELLERVTGTNKIQPDTDATIAGAEEDENYQNEVEAEDDNENHEDSDEDNEEVYYFYDSFFLL